MSDEQPQTNNNNNKQTIEKNETNTKMLLKKQIISIIKNREKKTEDNSVQYVYSLFYFILYFINVYKCINSFGMIINSRFKMDKKKLTYNNASLYSYIAQHQQYQTILQKKTTAKKQEVKK